MELKEIQISVREFARPSFRSGSLDANSGFGVLQELGAEIHRAIQERCARDIEGYSKEVSVSHHFKFEEYSIKVSGRIDGLIDARPPVLEEIKSTSSIDGLFNALKENPEHPYVLQTKTYAYFYFLAHGVIPKCRLRIVSNVNRKEKLFKLKFDLKEFETWVNKRCVELMESEIYKEWKESVRKGISINMIFPFGSYREGQRALVETVAESFASRRHILIQAPTGLGKTAGVMFPAVRESLSRGKPTIYITPKNSQHLLAEETVKKIQEHCDGIKSCTIIAKKKICMKKEPLCTPKHCEYAKDYYTKLSESKILEQLGKIKNLNAEIFREYAHKYEVCPFELSLECALSSEVVICDYNYIFAPRAVFASLFQDEKGESKEVNLVIDEAHNLYQRATDCYSPEIKVPVLYSFRKRYLELPEELQTKWRRLVSSCVSCVRRYDFDEAEFGNQKRKIVKVDIDSFLALERAISVFAFKYCESIDVLQPDDVVILLQRYWSDFCYCLGFDGQEFFSTYRKDDSVDSLKITCCDASMFLKETVSFFTNVAAFSATLKPFAFFAQMSGFDPNGIKTAEFSSPFPKENRKIVLIPQVSTKYEDRGQNYRKIGEAIGRLASVKPGNYFAFFPSYEFLQKTAEFISADGFEILSQKREMGAQDVEGVLEMLKAETRKVLFLAVQGGVFSEGMDYPGEMLIGAIIVGPGIPKYEFERELVKDYYNKKYGNGFDYAYIYPGMSKVVQSAGRVIRSQTDRGIIVLMDKRFTAPTYVSSMPSYWFESSVNELVSNSILKDLKTFWDQGI